MYSPPLIVQLVKNLPAIRRLQFNSWVRKICWRRDRLPSPVFLGFPCGSAGKESTSNAGDLGSIPGLGRSPGERKGYPLQYSDLENSMDCIVHGVTQSRIRLKRLNSSSSSSRIAGGFLSAEPQGKPKNTGVSSPFLLQQIFLTQELNWGLLHCRWILYQLSYHEDVNFHSLSSDDILPQPWNDLGL